MKSKSFNAGVPKDRNALPRDKTSKLNTTKKKDPKSLTFDRAKIKTFEQEYHIDMFSLKLTPVSIEYKVKTALEWVEVALADEDMLILEEFYIMKRISVPTIHKWMKDCPEMQEAHDFVMSILGIRREKGGLNNKYDSAIVRTSMAIYSIKWKQLEEWRNAMKEKVAGAGSSNIIVEMIKAPNSDLVPNKKDNNENGE